jgi:hypothetical protein
MSKKGLCLAQNCYFFALGEKGGDFNLGWRVGGPTDSTGGMGEGVPSPLLRICSEL